MKNLLITLIKLYQQLSPIRVSLLTSIGIPPAACRQTPSCSQYTINMIKTQGLIKGLILGFKRLSRCHPYSSITTN